MNRARQLSEELAEELDTLSPRHCSLFAAATSERLLPNYQAFSLLEGWGNYDALRSSLDDVWSAVIADDVPVLDVSPVKKMRRRCMKQAPDFDDFASVYVPLAQWATEAVVCALESIMKRDAKRTAYFAWICTRTVDNYLCEVGSPYLSHSEKLPDMTRRYVGDWDALDRLARARFWREQNENMGQELSEWIWSSPMMESELGALRDDIAYLKRNPHLNPATIGSLREAAMQRGIRPLQRHLVGRSSHPQ